MVNQKDFPLPCDTQSEYDFLIRSARPKVPGLLQQQQQHKKMCCCNYFPLKVRIGSGFAALLCCKVPQSVLRAAFHAAPTARDVKVRELCSIARMFGGCG